MNEDLISRSALLEKATNVTKYDEGGWGVDLLAVPLCDVKTAPAVDAETVFEQMGLVKEAMDMAKADLVAVVRCKDCKHSRERNEYERNYLVEGVRICTHHECSDDCWYATWPDHSCSYGERRADDAD